LKSRAAGGNTVDPEKEKQGVFRLVRGNKKMINESVKLRTMVLKGR
jgi:hypothetical protein